jgi:hypothetical protein
MSQGELIFVVRESPDGGYEARALGRSIFTQADSIEELREKVGDEVRAHFAVTPAPSVVLLQFVREEVTLAKNVSMSVGGSTSQASELSKDGKKLALDYFNHVETQVGLAATTAYLVLVADTILIGSFVAIFKDSVRSSAWADTAGMLLAVGMIIALVTVTPHMWKKTGTVFYYLTVARMRDGDYAEAFSREDRNRNLYAELLKQVQGKCQHLRRMFLGTIFAIIFLVLGTAVMLYAFIRIEMPPAGTQSSSPTYQRPLFH